MESSTSLMIPGFTPKEMELLRDADENGAQSIAPSLAVQFFQLFLEGYTCAQIAAQNKSFKEKDILYCRRKYKWDEEKDIYVVSLNQQIRDKLMKQRLESIEFLTNMVAVTHKEHREATLKYLQTGKEEDKPDTWINGAKDYKSIIEIIEKVTGEDKVSKVESKNETTINVVSNGSAVDPALQSKLLERFAAEAAKDIKE